MTTEHNPEFAEAGDQNAQGEEQLSQEIERSEGTPSWGEEKEQGLEEEPGSDEVSAEAGASAEIEENPSVDNEEGSQVDNEEGKQEETLPENPRRVLSFNDYFGNQN